MDQFITSVGIDIGTSTTQLVFSKIYIENTASSWSIPTIKIIKKEIIYKSKIHFTPLKTAMSIDSDRVRFLIEEEYKIANIEVDSVDTGAVIITGETARKENAKEVLNMLSDLAGDFVVATPMGIMNGPLLHYTFISNLLSHHLISDLPSITLLLIILKPVSNPTERNQSG